ncbi:MAG: hypothetical protein WBB48_12535 [Thermodesulfobacteriota bacterium]
MKKVLLVFSVLFLFSITGCDDNPDFGNSCNFDDLRENVSESVCLAEDFLARFGCQNTSCSSRDPDIRIGDRETCSAIDCQTLSCDNLRVRTFSPDRTMTMVVTAAGLVTDISVDETGLPTGFFEVDDLVGELSCVLVSP